MLDATFLKKYKRNVGLSWRADETYIKVKAEWKYLYRAVDKEGSTVDFLLMTTLEKVTLDRVILLLCVKATEPSIGCSFCVEEKIRDVFADGFVA